MTPYDIKPSPNPRIEVNLAFFLTESKDKQKKPHAEIATQIDEFEELPPSPKYIPKKTGIDAVTQVEDNELFDFDREVTPICDVVVTKILEQSALEIEEEVEVAKMHQFKDQFYMRRQ